MRFPIIIELRRSVRFALVNIAFHSVAFIAACAVPCPWLLRLFLVLLVICSGWKAFSSPTVAGLRILGSDRLDGVLKGETHVKLRVCQQSTVYQHMVLLRIWIGNESKVTSLVLFSDQMPEARFRQLRLWLRAQVPVDVTNGAGGSVS